MAIVSVRRCHYYYITVDNDPGEGHRLLSHLAGQGVSLLAMTAVPMGPAHTRVALVSEDEGQLRRALERTRARPDGPHHALLVNGEDGLRGLTRIHRTLFEAHVNVYGSTGVTNEEGSFGYLIYIEPSQYEIAAQALGV